MKQNLQRLLPSFVLLVYAMVATIGAFLGGIWALFALSLSVLVAAAVWYLDGKLPWPNKELMALVGAALAVLATHCLLSTQPEISWRVWLKLLSIYVPLSLLFSPRVEALSFHRSFFPIMLIAVVGSALGLSLELFHNGPLLRAVHGEPVWLVEYNRGVSYLVIMSFSLMAGLMLGPFPLALKKRLWILIPFIIILFIPTGLTESRASKLAFVSGLITVGIAYIVPVCTRWALTAGTVLCVSWPFLAQHYFLKYVDHLSQIPMSWQARMEIWDYLSYRIMEKPLLGWGLGAAHKLDFYEPNGMKYVYTTYPVSHPHNVITQLWVELGVPGLLLGLLFAALILHKTMQLDKKIIPYALGAYTAALCLSLVGYDFWTDSMYAAFALTGFAFAMLQKNRVKI
ncbi:MAG: O-antigen ligase family protein [Alphaproteobacteria bacterium]